MNGLYRDTIEGALSPTGLEGVLSKEKIEEIKRSGKSSPDFVTTRVEDPGLVPEISIGKSRASDTADSAARFRRGVLLVGAPGTGRPCSPQRWPGRRGFPSSA